ncbi:hypothetical protein GIB67_028982 [Kingdonia uniflora]|uniref:Uncharacterized protein n=1 Tax=Kingdonia uniflora TaxID=39325 RepID=A0A7J7LBY6_9MAGN|nr:hypothetical protein GIB67_028982 [Kingdonia uniflora]
MQMEILPPQFRLSLAHSFVARLTQPQWWTVQINRTKITQQQFVIQLLNTARSSLPTTLRPRLHHRRVLCTVILSSSTI